MAQRRRPGRDSQALQPLRRPGPGPARGDRATPTARGALRRASASCGEGMSGSGFYVILDGEATVRLGDEELNRLRRGDFFGEVSTLLDEPPTADVIAETPVRCLVIAGPQARSLSPQLSQGQLRMLQAEARRLQRSPRVAVVDGGLLRRANIRSSSSAAAPGGLQTTYCLSRLGVEHAVISQDDSPGRDVPQVADLPAAPLVDEAGRARRAHDSRVRVVRPQQPHRRRARAPSD